MAFTINDMQDLTRLLTLHPEWRAEVRRLVLTDEILALPELVRELVEAQQHTDRRIEQLVEAQQRAEARLDRLEAVVRELVEAQQRAEARLDRLEAVVRELVEAQRRTEARLDRLEATVEQLAEALQRLTLRVDSLAEALQRLTLRVDSLAEAQLRSEARLDRMEDRLSQLYGRDLERRYRERAGAYFGRWLRLATAVDIGSLREELEPRLGETDLEEIMNLDLLIRGQARRLPGTPEVWLALEVSAVIDRTDVERARRRATLLQQAGYQAIPAVGGERLTEGAQELAQESPLIVIVDGRSHGWEQALQLEE